MSIVKNIVNIQDNRLDYSINGTNSLRYIFRGTEHFRLTEVGGTSVCQFIAQKALQDGNFINQTVGSTNADFIGRVSNIDNHSIENLRDVDLTGLSNGDTLVYNGTKFVNGLGGVGSITLQDTSNGTSTLSFSSNFSILGTANQINTQVSTDQVTISLPSTLITPGTLSVTGLLNANGNITTGVSGLISTGNLSVTNNASITNDLTVGSDVTINGNLTVNGTQTIINTEIKLIEDPLIELGYSTSPLGSTVNDIGFFGQYQANNYAGLYYDSSSTAFRIFDSLGSNSYDLLQSGEVQMVPSAASIIARNFQTIYGSVGETIFTDSRTFTTNTTSNNIVTVPLVSRLAFIYGSTQNGIFSGKLIAYSYTNDSSGPGTSFFNSSVTLLNYVYLSYNNGSRKASFTVEIEDKTPNYAYINFSHLPNSGDSVIIDTNDATSLMTQGMSFTTVVKILPITGIA